MDERVATIKTGLAGDGLPSTEIRHAKVKCAECDGWTGTACPHGCGVRLIDVQADEDARFMAGLRQREEERRARRAESRQRRAMALDEEERRARD